jgi:hypothetical protein
MDSDFFFILDLDSLSKYCDTELIIAFRAFLHLISEVDGDCIMEMSAYPVPDISPADWHKGSVSLITLHSQKDWDGQSHPCHFYSATQVEW